MRLTQKIKDEIVENIIKSTDLIKEGEAIIKEEKHLAIEFVKSKIPTDFSELIKNAPKDWFYHISYMRMRAGTAEGAIKGICAYHIHFDTIPCPMNLCIDTDKSFPTYNKAVAWRKRYEELKSEIRALLNQYSTIEKLLKEHPYFEKHVPETAKKTYSIVANDANLILMLNQAGYKFESENE